MKYLPLFSLEIVHDYYTDRRCTDFAIVPTPETEKALKNCRGVLKSFVNGIQLMIPTIEPKSPFIPFSPDTSFVFQLWLQNSDFPLFTDLAELTQIAAPLYTNTNVEPVLELGSRETKTTEFFTVQQPSQTESFVLSGRPQPNLQAKDFLVRGLGAASKVTAYEEATKRITVNSQSVSASAPFNVTYVVLPPHKQDVFAEVEIKYDDALIKNLGTSTKFQILFQAKETFWKYYLVLDKIDTNPPVPTITDNENSVLFQEADRTDLVKTPDPLDRIAVQLAQQYPTLQCFRLVSKTAVPCRETARKAIQLQLSGDKVVDALPNPLIQNYVLEVRNAKEEYALYQVVKYFTHPLS